jgi:DNA-binding CsgD family transcriptional regulator
MESADSAAGAGIGATAASGAGAASADPPAAPPPRGRLRRWLPVLAYGAVGGLLLAALRWSEYRFLVVEHSFEIYGGLVAALFAAVGIWLGTRLTRKRPERVVVEIPVPVEVRVPVPVAAPFAVAVERQRELGITARELEVLELIAAGLSTREIGEKLFVSENTVKTHSARLFDKLDARRRTQAVQRGKELGLIP